MKRVVLIILGVYLLAALLTRAAQRPATGLDEIIAYHLEQAVLYRRELGPPDESDIALAAGAATLLNSVAVNVEPGSAIGRFESPFANLAFEKKATVFSILEGAPSFEAFRPLFGLLPALAAFLSYSEVGVFDPATRSIVATPIGWQISSYEGVADGRAELVGYFEGRRKANA